VRARSESPNGRPGLRRLRRTHLVVLIVLVAAVSAAAVWWGNTHKVVRGGAFEYRPEPATNDMETAAGGYLVLYVSKSAPGTFEELLASITGARLRPFRTNERRIGDGLGGEQYETSHDIAWVVANNHARTPVEYSTTEVVTRSDDPEVNVGDQVAVARNETIVVRAQNGLVLADTTSVRTTVRYRLTTPRPRSTQLMNINGTSSGLLAALAYLDLRTDGDLTDGRLIASTGTIRIDGTVGDVSNVKAKTEAAFAAGADVVFVPAGNYTEAVTAANDRSAQVVAVTSLDDAVAWLCETGGRSTRCDDVTTPR
jgi:hypothetical protein